MKKVLSILLIVSMLLTTNGFSVFADGLGNDVQELVEAESQQSSSESQEEVDEEIKEESLEEEADVTEITSESSSESEASLSESEASLSESSIEESLEESDIETTLDEEKIATASDVKNDDEPNIENDFEIATSSEVKEEILLGEKVNVASDSEIPKKFRYVDHNDEYLTYIDDSFVAPYIDTDNESRLFGADPLPSSYDAREHKNSTTNLSYVPPVRYQNPYGICWAFATIGMIETSIRKKGLVSNDSESNLSELALAYFVYNLENVTKSSDYDNLGGLAGNDYHYLNKSYYTDPEKATWSQCGGNQINSTKMMSAYLGAVIEDSVTEFSDDGNKTEAMINAEKYGLPHEYAFKKNAFVTKDIMYINKNNMDAIKKAIMDNGSVGFSYYSESNTRYSDGSWADAPAFHWEGSGDDKKSYYFSNDKKSTNHAIMIVGWDDNIPKEKFYYGGARPEEPSWGVYTKPPKDEEYASASKKATQNGAWLCRNSWSTTPPYLADGYFYISYDETSLSDTFYSIDAIDADTYKYNYHYDTTGAAVSAAPYGSNSQYANIFKVSGEDESQILEAVNIGVNSTNAEYDIKIYVKDSEMDHPTDGTLATSKRCSNVLAGFYTFELDDKVLMDKDSYFSIVVEPISSDGNKLYVFYDFLDEHDGYYYTFNEAKLGQSFFKSKNEGDGGWKDMNDSDYAGTAFYNNDEIDGKLYGNNWRIKALTNSGTGIAFDSNGGEGSMSFQNVTLGVPTSIKKCTFTKSGYKFSKWVEVGTSNEYGDEAEITINNSITLKAEWEPAVYTLTQNWYDVASAGMNEPDITSIEIKMYPTDPPTNADASWEIPGSGGLLALRKGTDVVIYASLTSFSGKINLPNNANHLFSKMDGANADSTDSAHVFSKCTRVDGLDLLDTSNVTDMSYMFDGALSLVSLDLSIFNTQNVTAMQGMFKNCSDLQEIIASSKFSTNQVTSSDGMFTNCSALTGGLGTRYTEKYALDSTIATNKTFAWIDGKNGNDGYFTGAAIVTVTFDLNGKGTSFTRVAEIGEAISEPTAPTYAGWTFNYWYKEGTSESTPYDFSQVLPSTSPTTIKLIAKWTANQYTIDYDLSGVSATKPNTITKTYGTPLQNGILQAPTSIPSRYKFLGWYKESTLDNVWTGSDDLTDVAGATVIIYAKWEYPKYSITYNLKGGNWTAGFSPIVERKLIESVTLPVAANVDKHGYTFAGWYENENYEGAEITNIAANVATDKVVFAKWSQNADTRIITFNDNYNGATVEQAFILGEDMAIRTNVFTRAGWTFVKWKDDSGNVYTNTNQLSDDIVLYAEWQKKSTPIPPGGGGNNGGSGGGSGGGGGAIPQNQQNDAKQTEVSTLRAHQTVLNGNTANWKYDPINNSWKLSAFDLNNAPINVANGFFVLSKIVVVMENNQTVSKLANDTYYFDTQGNMVDGWVKTSDGNKYFFNNEKTIDEGKLCIGWKYIGGYWYFFNGEDGSMLTNAVTPDGYIVGADGRMIQ